MAVYRFRIEEIMINYAFMGSLQPYVCVQMVPQWYPKFLRYQEFYIKMGILSLIFMKCKISSKTRMNAVGRAFKSLDILFLSRRILGTIGVPCGHIHMVEVIL